MKYIFLFLFITGLIACSSSNKMSQSKNGSQPCKVLMKGIQKSYTGACRRGLADGNGKAIGSDTYEGSFRHGLPDGKGTYKWANGAVYKGKWSKGKRQGYGDYEYTDNGQKVSQKGYWDDDKYVGTKPPPPVYSVSDKINIKRISIIKRSDSGNSIQVLFEQNGSDSKRIIKNLMLDGSSGENATDINRSFIGFNDVAFPFDGSVKYSIPNDFHTSTLDCELSFTINKPGLWVVTIEN